MRIRLAFEDPLPQYRCWYEVPTSCSTIHDLQRAIRKGFKLDQLCKTTRLDLDGFFLLPASTIAGLLKDDDLLQVMIRRKADNLPPRTLPAAGGKKRSSDEAGLRQPIIRKQKKSKASSGKLVDATDRNAGGPPKSGQLNQRARCGTVQPVRNNGDSMQTRIGRNNQTRQQQQSKAAPATTASIVKSAKAPAAPQVKPSAKYATQRTTSAEAAGKSRGKQSFSAKSVPMAPPSSSSDSSPSTSTSSDSSDSEDSTSDSDSDSDSDTSSDSDSPVASVSTQPVTKAVPGKGTPQTKARNARRKRLKAMAVHGTQEISQLALEACERITRPTVASKAPPPSAASVQKTTPAQTAPKVIMTTVELEDSNVMLKASKSLTSKRVTRSAQKSANGVHAKETAAEVGPRSEIVSEARAASTMMAAIEEGSDTKSVVRNYDELPKLGGHPSAGDVIAFKTLEMGPSYTPIISDFKEATVTKFSESDMVAEVQLGRRFRAPFEVDSDGQPIMGKFDVYDEQEVERARRGIVSLDMLSLADCRIITKQ